MKCSYLIIAVLVMFQAHGQTGYQANNACKRDLYAYSKVLYKMGKPEKGKAYHFVIKTIVDLNPAYSKPSHVEDEIDVKISSRTSIISNSKSVTFVDQQDAIAVVPDQKKIFISKGGTSSEGEEKYRQMGKLIDTLLDVSTVDKCEEWQKEGKKVRRVVLVPNQDFIQAVGVTKAEYLYDIVNKYVYKVALDYKQEHSVRKVQYEYLVLDYRYVFDDKKPVKSYVFDTNEKLLPAYKGYSVER